MSYNPDQERDAQGRYTHAQAHGAQPGRLARLQKQADEQHEKAQQASLRAWSTVKERS